VKRRFRLTPEARADLREILLDIATDSPDAAERLRSEFYEALQRLAQAPGIGHYHEELLDVRYRFWNFYSYVICYVWQEKPIQITAAVHGARDLAALLSTRSGF
jgi:plasmid stabilization system protein ParE